MFADESTGSQWQMLEGQKIMISLACIGRAAATATVTVARGRPGTRSPARAVRLSPGPAGGGPTEAAGPAARAGPLQVKFRVCQSGHCQVGGSTVMPSHGHRRRYRAVTRDRDS